ncbi:IclR family transcriptional regulator [Pseudoflavonifractor sp. 524-17]|uniref:IclR family transcriptional regulator n=1 Tax=Pseudoflavonifractor sp. 524-17 TaxID=2304577 RepID=UPI001379A295|nr:IclR family transcriptional regulator [Pseudoflavonifractor sp. 524-17]
MGANSRVKSLESALHVLNAIPEDSSISVTQLSKDTGLSKSTVCKILATYCDYGFVAQDPASKLFSLGPMLITKGQRALKNVNLRQVIRPYLKYLSGKFNENSMLMTQYGNAALISEYCEAEVPVRLAMRLSQVHELYYGAAPKVILANKKPEEQAALIDSMVFVKHTPATITSKEALYEVLTHIRETGFCYSGGEFDSSGVGIAVPIWDGAKTVAGGMAMNIPVFRVSEERLVEMIAEMKRCAVQVSEALGADPGEIAQMIHLDQSIHIDINLPQA